MWHTLENQTKTNKNTKHKFKLRQKKNTMKSIELMAPVNALINVPVRVRRDRWTADWEVQKAWHTNNQKFERGARAKDELCAYAHLDDIHELDSFDNQELSVSNAYYNSRLCCNMHAHQLAKLDVRLVLCDCYTKSVDPAEKIAIYQGT